MRKQLANYPILGIFPERKSPEFRYAQEADRPSTWSVFLYAGDVNDDHVAERVVDLALSGKAGVEERSVELICHDRFVVDCLRSQKSGHLTPEQGTAIQARSRDYFASFGNLFCLKI